MKRQLAAGKSCKGRSRSPIANNNPSLSRDSTLQRAFTPSILIDLHNKLVVIGGVLIPVSRMKKLRLSDLLKVT